MDQLLEFTFLLVGHIIFRQDGLCDSKTNTNYCVDKDIPRHR